ncbi:unnamed protein product [Sympodiomycopsis kandeliae]
MSSQQGLPDATLHKILEQIQLTLAQTSRQLSLVRAQKAGKEREKKGIELTRNGVDEEVKDGSRCFRGVGKMFIVDSPTAITKTLLDQEKQIQDEMDALNKKQKFLEKQFTEAQGHMRDFVRGVEQKQES